VEFLDQPVALYLSITLLHCTPDTPSSLAVRACSPAARNTLAGEFFVPFSIEPFLPHPQLESFGSIDHKLLPETMVYQTGHLSGKTFNCESGYYRLI